MNGQTLLRASVRSILKNRTRALLTVSGVVIGVAAVIVMVAVGQGARDEIRNRVTRLGTNLILGKRSALFLPRAALDRATRVWPANLRPEKGRSVPVQ